MMAYTASTIPRIIHKLKFLPLTKRALNDHSIFTTISSSIDRNTEDIHSSQSGYFDNTIPVLCFRYGSRQPCPLPRLICVRADMDEKSFRTATNAPQLLLSQLSQQQPQYLRGRRAHQYHPLVPAFHQNCQLIDPNVPKELLLTESVFTTANVGSEAKQPFPFNPLAEAYVQPPFPYVQADHEEIIATYGAGNANRPVASGKGRKIKHLRRKASRVPTTLPGALLVATSSFGAMDKRHPSSFQQLEKVRPFVLNRGLC